MYETEHVVRAIECANRMNPELQPVGEMRLQKNKKNKEEEKVTEPLAYTFHHCVAAPPVNRSQRNCVCSLVLPTLLYVCKMK